MIGNAIAMQASRGIAGIAELDNPQAIAPRQHQCSLDCAAVWKAAGNAMGDRYLMHALYGPICRKLIVLSSLAIFDICDAAVPTFKARRLA